MLVMVVKIVFWVCVAAMLHTYLLYPLSLRLFRRRYVLPPEMLEDRWPSVAVLIPAYNEEKVIADKVRHSLDLDYPPDRLKVLVGSDGSTDRTNDLVRCFLDSRLHLIELPGRSGKSGVYNRLVTETEAEILVFTDANVSLDSLALRKLVRHFADPRVGVACGGKYIVLPTGAESVNAEVVYGRFENAIRTLESQVGGMSGALGSLMAVRRSLYHPYPPGSINDDTVPSLWAVLAGMRNVHDPEAKAFEESGHTIAEEFRRRIRISAGNFQTLFRYLAVLQPRHGLPAYTYFSHKVLRWIFPLLMIGALLSSAALAGREFFRLVLFLQIAFYGVALLGWLLDRLRLPIPLVTALYHFVALNAGLLMGFAVYCRGVRSSAWERTARETAA